MNSMTMQHSLLTKKHTDNDFVRDTIRAAHVQNEANGVETDSQSAEKHTTRNIITHSGVDGSVTLGDGLTQRGRYPGDGSPGAKT